MENGRKLYLEYVFGSGVISSVSVCLPVVFANFPSFCEGGYILHRWNNRLHFDFVRDSIYVHCFAACKVHFSGIPDTFSLVTWLLIRVVLSHGPFSLKDLHGIHLPLLVRFLARHAVIGLQPVTFIWRDRVLLISVLYSVISCCMPVENRMVLVKASTAIDVFVSLSCKHMYHIRWIWCILHFDSQDTNRLEYLIPKKTSLRHRLPMGDQGFTDFVAHLLEVNPKKRPTAADALRHPWLSYPYEPISSWAIWILTVEITRAFVETFPKFLMIRRKWQDWGSHHCFLSEGVSQEVEALLECRPSAMPDFVQVLFQSKLYRRFLKRKCNSARNVLLGSFSGHFLFFQLVGRGTVNLLYMMCDNSFQVM